ncbi:N5-glutamine methyltransferase family protein [Demequina lignilytica]|uniref:Class I SAM-dependent methyltransferase n=1 Tax=Demequina lignilytica TaxID=3051663 RepID=A0AB35MJ99_9MICO|nr:class I SAM-dependent methyltransferase [Demequina sp. SYSU T0a273]MDN4483848.1 class I SAM-dependent methyltransferase [Demequina sp. SYSU T0a273]
MTTPQLDRADALRAALATWTVDAVEAVCGERATRALAREQVLPARLAARASSTPEATLTRVFLLGDAVPVARLDDALPGVGADGAAAMGLVELSAGEARARVDLRPYETTTADGEARWWVASDLGEDVTGERLEADHVLGIGGASLTLAGMTKRSPVGRVLDLGTGCGIQALHASLHARAVVATDISRRALAFAEFNRALNTAGAWDLREGSMLEPVAGERFDLVVSNPPFVITPPGTPEFEYRAAGAQGDGIVSGLISSVGSVLAPGGVAQMLGNWEIHGAGWADGLEAWLAASPVPLDAWVIERDQLDAAEYAETWLRDAGVTPERGRAAFEDAYEAYLSDFDARGVTAVGFGMVLLRRPLSGAPTLRRLEQHEGALQEPFGAYLVDALAAHDLVASLSDQALLDARWMVAADVTRESYGPVLQADPSHLLLRQGAGLGRSISMDTALAGFVGACDGELAAGQIAHALAALLDVPSGVMIEGLVPAIRELVADGFLAPAAD